MKQAKKTTTNDPYVSIASSSRRQAGEKLLSSGSLIYCKKKKNGIIEALFKEQSSDKLFKTSIRDNYNLSEASCSCRSPESCAHIQALILHNAKFANQSSNETPKNAKPEYGALLSRDTDSLLSEARAAGRNSCLKLFFEDGFPHLPAKWSVLKLTVEIISGSKTYKGNIGNLRQIHNKGTLGGLLSDNLFSLQERQIIRYLSFNADYENSFLLLNAEKASDFFHCLSGFRNVFCPTSKLSFFGESCSLAAGILNCANKTKILPFLRIKTSYVNIENASFIIGQNGAWIGILGNYFWVPGTKDIKWMRDFVRYEKIFDNTNELEAEIKKIEDAEIEIAKSSEIRKIKKKEIPKTVLLAKFAKNSVLTLNLLFRYSHGIFQADFSQSAFSGDGLIIERNIKAELAAVNKILFVGFKEDKKQIGTYFSSDKELIGLFFSQFVSEWRQEFEIYIDNPNDDIKEKSQAITTKIDFKALPYSADSNSFTINCEIRAGKNDIPIETLIKACEKNSEFVESNDGLLAEIPSDLKDFVLSSKDILKTAQDGKIRLSKAQAIVWDLLAENFENAKVSAISLFRNKLRTSQLDMSPPRDFIGELRPYQREGITWILSRFQNGLNCILADEMGLGKTIQAIYTTLKIRETKKTAEKFNALILCPSTLTGNWLSEFAKFATNLKTILLHGMGREEKWAKISDADVIISSYSTFKRDIEKHNTLKYDLIILDEAQHIKNPETGNARSCKKIEATHKLVLTGTPVENAPLELWSIIDFLHPGILGSHNSFKKQFESENINDSLKRFSTRISPLILRRRKIDVLPQLPPKTEQMLYCEMDEIQGEAYLNIFKKFKDRFKELNNTPLKPGVKFEMLTLLLRLRQFCCHPSLLPDEFETKNLPSCKTELLKELVLEAEDSGQKTLVFSQFPSILKIIAEWLKTRSADFEYLDGSTTDRIERVKRFNTDSSCGVFLLSIKAGAYGLNLSSAERVIIYDPWWNPAVEKQAADRAHRIGQLKPVNIQKLIVKNSIEEKILVLQDRKKDYFEKLIEGAPSAFKDISLDDIKILFS